MGNYTRLVVPNRNSAAAVQSKRVHKRSLLPLLTIARPPVGLFSAGAALLTYHVAGGDLSPSRTLPILVTVFAITSAGFVINDYFDVEKDIRNSIERPLPQGLVSRRAALWEASILFALGLAASAFLGPPLMTLALANTLLLIAYSPLVQRTHGALANVVVGYLSASALLFGALAAGNPRSAAPAILFIFAISLVREVVFDVADATGDRLSGLTTLPVAYGEANAFRVAWIVLVTTATAVIGVAALGLVSAPGLFLASAIAALMLLAAGLYRYQRLRTDSSYATFGVVASHLSFLICGVVIYSGRLSLPDTGARAGRAFASVSWSEGLLLGGVMALLVVSSLTLSRYNK